MTQIPLYRLFLPLPLLGHGLIIFFSAILTWVLVYEVDEALAEVAWLVVLGIYFGLRYLLILRLYPQPLQIVFDQDSLTFPLLYTSKNEPYSVPYNAIQQLTVTSLQGRLLKHMISVQLHVGDVLKNQNQSQSSLQTKLTDSKSAFIPPTIRFNFLQINCAIFADLMQQKGVKINHQVSRLQRGLLIIMIVLMVCGLGLLYWMLEI